MKSFWQKNKNIILHGLLIVGGVVAVSVISLLILQALDVVTFDGEMHFNEEKFSSFQGAWYGWIFFILLQTVLSMLLCVIPGASMAFILLFQTIFVIPWQNFLVCFASVSIASFSMYAVGRFGGYALCEKLMGEDDCKRALGLLRNKGSVYFPFMMLFPFFPDEALTMVAGTIKMPLAWFAPSILVARGIGIATIVFGVSSIPFDKFTAWWHWVLFIGGCAAIVVAVLLFASRFNKFMEKRRLAAEAEEAKEQK
ncbi:MAG: VTT domain-containing protein [Clostridia bacterium]|nr:VTT domain-containing protein [Clostridia bacterium]